MMERTPNKVLAELGLLSLMWGSTFLLMKLAVPTVPAFAMSAVRGLLAAAILWIVVKVVRSGSHPHTPIGWRAPIVLGTLSGWLPNVLTAWALLRLDSSVAGMLSAASPIFVVILAHFFLTAERLLPIQIVGVVIGFFGVVLIIGIDPGALDGDHLAGQLAMIAVAASYAAGTVYARRIGPQDAPRLAQRQQLVAGSVALVAAVLFEQAWEVRPEPIALAAIVALAIWASAIPIWLYFRMLAHTRAVTVSLVAYLVPAVAVILGAVLLGERLDPRAALGLLIVLGGVYVTTRKPKARAAPSVSTAGIEPGELSVPEP
jgi:drug/metabolite transporter (DMT)-like permease